MANALSSEAPLAYFENYSEFEVGDIIAVRQRQKERPGILRLPNCPFA